MVSRQQNRPLMALVVLLTVAGTAVAAASIDMSYCASINTGSTSANYSVYQSDGLCYDFCLDDYAFAIVQEYNCWCGNYAPAKAVDVDTDECDTSCPGYPDDTCGGGTSLWGYMTLTKEASGTSGAATSTKAATTQDDTTTATVQNTVTVTPTTSTTTTSVDDATDTPTTTTTSPTDTDTTESPSISVATTTQDGSVIFKTVTVAHTSTPTTSDAVTSSGSSSAATSSHSGLSTGAAVGIAVGVLAALVIMGAAAVFLWLRRKRRLQEEEMDNQGSVRGSSAGMMSTPRTEMASVWDGDTSAAGRRNSRLMPHDPRMDPNAVHIYNRFDNKSQESVNTLRDDYDYSRRVLRTTNPDPSG